MAKKQTTKIKYFSGMTELDGVAWFKAATVPHLADYAVDNLGQPYVQTGYPTGSPVDYSATNYSDPESRRMQGHPVAQWMPVTRTIKYRASADLF
jgi:hypothetical protein